MGAPQLLMEEPRITSGALSQRNKTGNDYRKDEHQLEHGEEQPNAAERTQQRAWQVSHTWMFACRGLWGYACLLTMKSEDGPCR